MAIPSSTLSSSKTWPTKYSRDACIWSKVMESVSMGLNVCLQGHRQQFMLVPQWRCLLSWRKKGDVYWLPTQSWYHWQTLSQQCLTLYLLRDVWHMQVSGDFSLTILNFSLRLCLLHVSVYTSSSFIIIIFLNFVDVKKNLFLPCCT